MADYWIQIDLHTDRDVAGVTNLAAELATLAGIDADVTVSGTAVTRWTDDGEPEPVEPDPSMDTRVDIT